MTRPAGGTPTGDFDVVEIRDVSRHFGRRRALARVSLTCRAGEILGLFGPNGAGKSTLLGIVSTLVRPTQGDVRYGTQSARESGERLRARIGVLGHDLFLYGDLTARENLEFFGRLYSVPDLAARVTAALGHARLDDRANDRVSGFSRGLRQRLALERALLHTPRLVLLDEPFTGLDDESAFLLSARLKTLKASGAIVVLATHDFNLAEGLMDRVVCLRNGRIRELEPSPSSLRERYRRAMQEEWGVIGILQAAWIIARKDLVVEVRSRELAYTTLFFAVACILVFAFAFVDTEGNPIPGAPAGILWVAIAFSGTLALGRTFERERQSETLRALLLSPVERPAVYLGKLLALLMLMLGVEAVIVPLVGLLFGAPIGVAPLLLLGLILTGTLGFAAVGALFAAMLVRARSRDVLLPVLLYPIAVPVVIAGVQGTQAIFAAEPNFASASMWMAMLVLFDAVFVTLALWTFGPVMSE